MARHLGPGERLVLASHNAGKLAEIADLVRPLGLDVVSAGNLGLAEPAEDAPDFVGNARIKALAAARASGLPALVDRRGETDRDGRKLEVTQVAFGDMIAAASGLVSGEAAEGIPAVLLRGWRLQAPERPASALLRPLEEDLFQ